MTNENIFHMPTPSERVVSKAAEAMKRFSASTREAVQSVIQYGLALNEGKGLPGNNATQAFSQWVSANGLDVGQPWEIKTERSKAMTIAKVAELRTVLNSDFDNCPNTWPSDIFAWLRKNYPEAVDKCVKRRAPSKDKASRGSRATGEEGAGKEEAGKEKKATKEDEALAFIHKFVKEHGRSPTYMEIQKGAGVSAGTAQSGAAMYKTEQKERDKKLDQAQLDQVEASLAMSDKEKLKLLQETIKKRLEREFEVKSKKLEREFEVRVQERVKQIVDTLVLPAHQKELDEANFIKKTRKGVFTKVQFNKLIMALHPDKVSRFNDAHLIEQFNECARLLTENKLALLTEKEMPTSSAAALPSSFEEMEARRQAKAEAKKKR